MGPVWASARKFCSVVADGVKASHTKHFVEHQEVLGIVSKAASWSLKVGLLLVGVDQVFTKVQLGMLESTFTVKLQGVQSEVKHLEIEIKSIDKKLEHIEKLLETDQRSRQKQWAWR